MRIRDRVYERLVRIATMGSSCHVPAVRDQRRWRSACERRSGCSRRPTASPSRAAASPTAPASGWFDDDGRPWVAKQPLAAYEDLLFAHEARERESRVFIAHIRYATTGGIEERNTHPFEQQGRLFAHNGVVHGLEAWSASWGRPRAGRGRDRLRALFALVTRETERHRGDVGAGIAAAARWVAEHLPLYSHQPRPRDRRRPVGAALPRHPRAVGARARRGRPARRSAPRRGQRGRHRPRALGAPRAASGGDRRERADGRGPGLAPLAPGRAAPRGPALGVASTIARSTGRRRSPLTLDDLEPPPPPRRRRRSVGATQASGSARARSSW